MIYKPFALFLIASSVISTGAEAGKVYKCGNSYSQVPCADGVELTTPAEPSAQQQRAARKSSQWDEKTGSALEKERLNAEKAALKEQLAADKARKAQEKSDEKEKTKDSKKSKKEPEFFIAKAPAAKASQPK
jgi:hypothetical protein